MSNVLKVVGFCIGLLGLFFAHHVSAADFKIHIPSGSRIVAQGDSLTYGQDNSTNGVPEPINRSTQPRSSAPYPEALEKIMNGCAHVINQGYPGDRSVDGLVRWQNEASAKLTILMYGSNDALNNGNAPTGVVSNETFAMVLNLLVKRRQNEGSEIILLVPPPLRSSKPNNVIEPYRNIVRKFAKQHHLPVIDTVDLFKKISQPWLEDGTHLSVQANELLANELAKHIVCK